MQQPYKYFKINFSWKDDRNILLALELGGQDLETYYHERVPQHGRRRAKSNEAFLIKIIKGAALALAQFHKCYYNFILFLKIA